MNFKPFLLHLRQCQAYYVFRIANFILGLFCSHSDYYRNLLSQEDRCRPILVIKPMTFSFTLIIMRLNFISRTFTAQINLKCAFKIRSVYFSCPRRHFLFFCGSIAVDHNSDLPFSCAQLKFFIYLPFPRFTTFPCELPLFFQLIFPKAFVVVL